MITILIETDNDAFMDDPGAEVARILRRLAEKADIGIKDMEAFEAYISSTPIRDENGNRVGTVTAR